MKKSAHTHSAFIQNRQFRARITHEECGYFDEVGRKTFFVLITLNIFCCRCSSEYDAWLQNDGNARERCTFSSMYDILVSGPKVQAYGGFAESRSASCGEP